MIDLSRRESAATVLGGPTTVIDLGGLRIASDVPRGVPQARSEAAVRRADAERSGASGT